MRLVITRLELDKFVSNMLNMSGHSGVMSAPHTTQDMTVHQMDLVCLLGYVLGFYECAMCWVSMNIKISEYWAMCWVSMTGYVLCVGFP